MLDLSVNKLYIIVNKRLGGSNEEISIDNFEFYDMVISASAYTDLEKNGAYCTAYKSSSSSVYASTSTKDGSKKTVGVNIVLYYTKSGNTLNTGSGNSYTRGVSTTCSTPSGGTFKSATITHKLNNATVYTVYLV